MIATTSTNAANNNAIQAREEQGGRESYGFRERNVYGRGSELSFRYTPRSQQQYDGDNPFDDCEVWSI